ncbi:helix-turn-helix transcriptional regulator [Herbiconiux sp. 11R-BC]|uniref:helix-turn-helix transcriptional regulator n=1 Tax=Herbiconiux sp. 11R-BC TaxID=3111637 RepID=UPI003C08FD8B
MAIGASALGEYLRARRGLVQPADAGIVPEPGRRVSGLRRREVAELAGVSADYYLRLEQGRDQRPSEQVLTAIGRALQLDPHAMEYMFRLAYGPGADEPPRSAAPGEDLLALLEHWADTPAYITDGNHDIVASNALAHRIGHGFLDVGGNNVVAFFDAHTRAVADDWENSAAQLAAALRFDSDPASPRLAEIVSQLTAADPEFERVWRRHDARPLSDGVAQHYLEGFGSFPLRFQNLTIPGYPGYILTTMFAEPDTVGVAVLAYLAAQRP